jgi:hypothetical protein
MGDPVFCSSVRHNTRVRSERIKSILFAMVELVEKAVAKEMREAGCGALMHDAWTKVDVHYIGIFACYMRNINIVVDNQKVSKKEATSALLSVSPMASKSNDGTTGEDDASTFDAWTMKEHFENLLLQFYNVNVYDWVKAIIADNAQVNIKLCNLLHVPHIGCRNHLLALDLKDSIAEDQVLNDLIDRVCDGRHPARPDGLQNTK